MATCLMVGLLIFCLALGACGAPETGGTTTVSGETTTSTAPTTTTTAVQMMANADKEYFYKSKEEDYTLHTVTLARKAEETAQKGAGVTVSVALPKGLLVQGKDPGHTFPYIEEVFGAQYVVNSKGACVGVIGYLYDDSGDTTVQQPPTVYSYIWLGSLRFATIPDTYSVVESPSKTENAMSQMFHSANQMRRGSNKTLEKDVYNPLMLCYDRESRYAVVLELGSDALTAAEVIDITQSMQIQPIE